MTEKVISCSVKEIKHIHEKSETFKICMKVFNHPVLTKGQNHEESSSNGLSRFLKLMKRFVKHLKCVFSMRADSGSAASTKNQNIKTSFYCLSNNRVKSRVSCFTHTHTHLISLISVFLPHWHIWLYWRERNFPLNVRKAGDSFRQHNMFSTAHSNSLLMIFKGATDSLEAVNSNS